MTTDLAILKCGNCEELKTGVHAAALVVAAVCGLYNAAAWLSRRDRHLAVNTVLYTALAIWEQRHVMHHVEELRRPRPRAVPARVEPVETPIAA